MGRRICVKNLHSKNDDIDENLAYSEHGTSGLPDLLPPTGYKGCGVYFPPAKVPKAIDS